MKSRNRKFAFASPVALVCPPCAVNLNTCWKLNWMRASQFQTWESNQCSCCISAPTMGINFKLHFLSKQLLFFWPSGFL